MVGTCCILYFGSVKKYLLLARFQIYTSVYILDKKKGIYNQLGFGYILAFIF